MNSNPVEPQKGSPSAGDAHLLSAAESLSIWISSHRGEALGAKRVATLMTAFAAEAYVNAALLNLARRAEFDALNRLATPEKFFVGLGYFQRDLATERGTEHGRALVSLFKARNALTHSKIPHENVMFVPRMQVGAWLGAVAEIVSQWPEKGNGLIPPVFGEYTSHFADRSPALKDDDPEVQLGALADALDASSPLSLMYRTSSEEDEQATVAIEQTDLGPARRDVLWGKSSSWTRDFTTGEMVEEPERRIAKP